MQPQISLDDLPDKELSKGISLDDLPDQDETDKKDKILTDAKKSLDTNKPTEAKKQEPSLLNKAWHAISDPLTDAPSRFAHSISDYITTPHLDDAHPMLKGFAGGIIQGVGDLASSLTSPLNLGLSAVGFGEANAAKAGLESLVPTLTRARQALSVPFAAHGAINTFSPDSTGSERLQGIAEMAGGAAGIMHTPSPNIPRPESVPEPINPQLDNIRRNAPYGEGSIMPSPTLPTEMRGESVPQDDFPPIHFREDKMPPPSPDLTPVGQEEDYNSMFGGSGRKPLADLQYELAQDKFGMGKPMEQKPFEGAIGEDLKQLFDKAPETNLPSGYEPIASREPIDIENLPHPTEESVPHDVTPTAEFLALGEDGKPVYNIKGGPRDKSTVTAETLKQDGIEVPETPADAKPMRGSEIRELALKQRQATANDYPQDIKIKPSLQLNPKGKAGFTSGEPEVSIPNATPEDVKAAMENGYKFTGVNDDGTFKFSNAGGPPNKPPILESEIPPSNDPNRRAQLGGIVDKKKASVLQEIANFPRGVMASWDLSAPFRQGIGLIHKAAWWKAWAPMFKSFGSENAFQAVQQSIAERPLFKPRTENGKLVPSFAEQAGLNLPI
jgi:hypothetical protein